MRHPKKEKAQSSRPQISNEYQLLQQKDFAVLAEIHKVLSPYWSVRSTYSRS